MGGRRAGDPAAIVAGFFSLDAAGIAAVSGGTMRCEAARIVGTGSRVAVELLNPRGFADPSAADIFGAGISVIAGCIISTFDDRAVPGDWIGVVAVASGLTPSPGDAVVVSVQGAKIVEGVVFSHPGGFEAKNGAVAIAGSAIERAQVIRVLVVGMIAVADDQRAVRALNKVAKSV